MHFLLDPVTGWWWLWGFGEAVRQVP